jgi:hypothetical protein
MKNNLMRALTVFTLSVVVLLLTAWAIASSAQKNSQTTQTQGTKLKTLREIARERDVETDVSEMEESAEYEDLHVLAKHAEAIVVVRVSDEESAFDGDNHISTSYHLEVLNVLKHTKLNAPLGVGDQPPAPLVTPLKLVRPGGVVMVNDRRAFAKLKGSEPLKSGRHFLLFLWWSPARNAYTLAGGVSGAFLIDMEQRLRPLGSKAGMRKYDGNGLQALIDEVLAAD